MFLLLHASDGKSNESDVKNVIIFYRSIQGKNTHKQMIFSNNLEKLEKAKANKTHAK